MAYGMANSGYGRSAGTLAGYYLRQGSDGSRYYQIENIPGSLYEYYASNQTGTDGKPLNNGAVPPDVVIVTAYGQNNRILQSYWITAPEVQ